jgi:hypothetical protein
LVTARPFVPAFRLAGRPGAELAALAALVDGGHDDLESILLVLGLTDSRVRDAAGAFAMLPPTAQYRGPSAATVMMPFLCPSVSRFSSGRYGVLYGAESYDTAAAEVSHHHAIRLKAMAAPSDTQILLKLWLFTISSEIADLRTHDASIYHPENYGVAQSLGQTLREAGAAGVLYASVRRHGGECIGVFIPKAVDTMEIRDDWRLVWNGNAISEVLRAV